MQDKYLIIVSSGYKHSLIKDFHQKYLVDNDFKIIGKLEAYLYGYIEINLTKREYRVLIELTPSEEVKGPVLVLDTQDQYRDITNYIEGSDEIREHIIKKLNKKISIRLSSCLNGSPAFQFAIKAYAQFTNPDNDQLTISGESRLFYAVDEQNNTIIGCIIFDIIPQGCYDVCYIRKSYVEPEYRNQGIWKMMWRDLETSCRVNKIPRIDSRVYKHNQVMKSVCEHTNRELKSHNYSYIINL